jgi:hypothetical protein
MNKSVERAQKLSPSRTEIHGQCLSPHKSTHPRTMSRVEGEMPGLRAVYAPCRVVWLVAEVGVAAQRGA